MSAALRVAMAKHRVSVKALSMESGISQTSISSMTNERTKPWTDTCYIITEALCRLTGKNYRVDQLFPHVNLKRYAR